MTTRPPVSATLIGSIAAAGTLLATRMVAPGLRAGQARHATKPGSKADTSEKRQRQPQQAAAANEFAPADSAVHESVDQMVFEISPVTPENVENLVVLHGFFRSLLFMIGDSVN
jgi:hypothetical protein